MRTVLACSILLVAGGCASGGPTYAGWPGGPRGGRVVESRHYAIHTTIRDDEFLALLAATMERALDSYETLAPADPPAEAGLLPAYVFAVRDEWAEFTRERAGSQAPLLLRIGTGRGGYAREGYFATFRWGTPVTLAICRHEGWHQYVETRFAARPPPFLEEGLAAVFEFGLAADGRPLGNTGRLNELREAVRRQRVRPLSTLLRLHAGIMLGAGDWRQTNTFYAQAWALAVFLISEHRAGLRSMLIAYAAGEVVGGPQRMLERHLGLPFDEISRQYEAYVREMVAVPG